MDHLVPRRQQSEEDAVGPSYPRLTPVAAPPSCHWPSRETAARISSPASQSHKPTPTLTPTVRASNPLHWPAPESLPSLVDDNVLSRTTYQLATTAKGKGSWHNSSAAAAAPGPEAPVATAPPAPDPPVGSNARHVLSDASGERCGESDRARVTGSSRTLNVVNTQRRGPTKGSMPPSSSSFPRGSLPTSSLTTDQPKDHATSYSGSARLGSSMASTASDSCRAHPSARLYAVVPTSPSLNAKPPYTRSASQGPTVSPCAVSSSSTSPSSSSLFGPIDALGRKVGQRLRGVAGAATARGMQSRTSTPRPGPTHGAWMLPPSALPVDPQDQAPGSAPLAPQRQPLHHPAPCSVRIPDRSSAAIHNIGVPPSLPSPLASKAASLRVGTTATFSTSSLLSSATVSSSSSSCASSADQLHLQQQRPEPSYMPVAAGMPAHQPGSVVPVLLPGYVARRVARDRHSQGWAAVDAPEDLDDGAVELDVYAHGMVLRTPEAAGTWERVFNQMARQLAGLPKIARQPSAAASTMSMSSPASTAGLLHAAAPADDPLLAALAPTGKPHSAEPKSMLDGCPPSASASATEAEAGAEAKCVPITGAFAGREGEDAGASGGALEFNATVKAGNGDDGDCATEARDERRLRMRDKLTHRLMRNVNEEALARFIDRARILPNDRPNDADVAREHGAGAKNKNEADSSESAGPEVQRTLWSAALASRAERQVSVATGSASAPRMAPTPADGGGSGAARPSDLLASTSSLQPFSRRERAMAKLHTLKTVSTRLQSDSRTSSPIGAGAHIDEASAWSRRGATAWLGRSLPELQQLQRNLESRLHAFWMYRVEHREVRIEIEPTFSNKVQSEWAEHGIEEPRGMLLATTTLWTNSSGCFEHKLIIPWCMLESYCEHHEATRGVHPVEIVGLRMRAVLLKHKNPSQKASEPVMRGEGSAQSEVPLGATSYGYPQVSKEAGENRSRPPDHFKNHVDAESTLWMELDVTDDGRRKVRVISDIDDTVKHTDIVGGIKSVFQNVFVKPFNEVTVDGVARWYQAMTAAGAPVHYVSNAPLELYGLVQGFLEVAGMPLSHLHMKLYPTGTRNLLASWLEPAGERKRGAVEAILNDFPGTSFILVGDSGELDLELYSALAAERPHQIRAIFIRDVSSPRPRAKPTASPSLMTNEEVMEDAPTIQPPAPADIPPIPGAAPGFFDTSFPDTASNSMRPPILRRITFDSMNRSSPSSLTHSSALNSRAAPPSSTGDSRQPVYLTEAEFRRREIFRARVHKAKEIIPRSTLLKFYRTGCECEEDALKLIWELQQGTRRADCS
ncbi:hypothetical protein K437DRAFT_275318 [Tilletiaria anomala UBC 951]|uniref:Phosphatidate phosphatase APP1 catalytic domain-containing protein n=1 Tax=Tilletiaria anomala (strain ATCC 24038 / CBS 436.72 / UBC 951) TaxID=1037660 RepID=A0A066VKA8_TILAU|nr:uncharacterized protein K437DRAFT_275318 [Tilletiaria anomala UBC 951]KDN41871.1 hypothetical protein K437DRAFT_275318 [Tilletiaria anomala UBC 951]